MTMTTPSTAGTDADAPADVVAERIFSLALAGAEALSIYVGDRLGWYKSLAASGPATPVELARRTATHERYAREWLEQQAVCGLLVAHSRSTEPDGRRYELAPGAPDVRGGRPADARAVGRLSHR